MQPKVKIGDRWVGPGEPCYVIGEIGLNHNGDVAIAKRLIESAKVAGCDAVKFQKRTPDLCVPPAQRDLMRETPWGIMSYIEYRRRIELGQAAFEEIDQHCKRLGIQWFASCWDEPSVDFIEAFHPPCYKIPSASLTDDALLKHHRRYGRPIILSTGMSTTDEIDRAVNLLGEDNLVLMHTTSTYPCKPEELNLRVIPFLKNRYRCPIGYSGHETGLQTTLAAVALGAVFVERHITLDRAMWGSDQAASVEPYGMIRLVRDIRTVEAALGDGVKQVYKSEVPILEKLRRVRNPAYC
jgi:N-acetylneuraminate synthase